MTASSITIQLLTYDFAEINMSPAYSGCINAFRSNICGEVIISADRIDKGLQDIFDCMNGEVPNNISCIQPIGLPTMCHDPSHPDGCSM